MVQYHDVKKGNIYGKHGLPEDLPSFHLYSFSTTLARFLRLDTSISTTFRDARQMVTLSNQDGYQALYSILTLSHPQLQETSYNAKPPTQGNQTLATHCQGFETYIANQQCAGLPYTDLMRVKTVMDNLDPRYNHIFNRMREELKGVEQDEQLPFDLLPKNLPHALLRWDREYNLRHGHVKQSQQAFMHTIQANIQDLTSAANEASFIAAESSIHHEKLGEEYDESEMAGHEAREDWAIIHSVYRPPTDDRPCPICGREECPSKKARGTLCPTIRNICMGEWQPKMFTCMVHNCSRRAAPCPILLEYAKKKLQEKKLQERNNPRRPPYRSENRNRQDRPAGTGYQRQDRSGTGYQPRKDRQGTGYPRRFKSQVHSLLAAMDTPDEDDSDDHSQGEQDKSEDADAEEYAHTVLDAIQHNVMQPLDSVMEDTDFDDIPFQEEFDCTPLVNLAVSPLLDARITDPDWSPDLEIAPESKPVNTATKTLQAMSATARNMADENVPPALRKKIKQASHLLQTAASINSAHTPDCDKTPIIHAMYLRQDRLRVIAQLDSGANVNCTNNSEHLHDYKPIKRYSINVGDSGFMDAIGVGYLHQRCRGGKVLQLKAYHTPKAPWPVLSPNAIMATNKNHDYGYTIHVDGQRSPGGFNSNSYCHIHNPRPALAHKINIVTENRVQFTTEPLILPKMTIKRYQTEATPPLQLHDPHVPVVNLLNTEGLQELWHQRLGCLPDTRLAKTRSMTIGIPEFKVRDQLHSCDSCIAGRLTKAARHKVELCDPEEKGQDIQIDFGFFAPRAKKQKHDAPQGEDIPNVQPESEPGTIQGRGGWQAYCTI
eukprot:scaffold7102_cov34-Attheya_sp.AAC.4